MNNKVKMIVLFLLSMPCMSMYASNSQDDDFSQAIDCCIKDINTALKGQQEIPLNHKQKNPLEDLKRTLEDQKYNKYETAKNIFTRIALYQGDKNSLSTIKNSKNFETLNNQAAAIYYKQIADTESAYFG